MAGLWRCRLRRGLADGEPRQFRRVAADDRSGPEQWPAAGRGCRGSRADTKRTARFVPAVDADGLAGGGDYAVNAGQSSGAVEKTRFSGWVRYVCLFNALWFGRF